MIADGFFTTEADQHSKFFVDFIIILCKHSKVQLLVFIVDEFYFLDSSLHHVVDE